MKRLTRLSLVLALLTALLPSTAAVAQQEPADPICAQVAAGLGAAYESVWLDGAITCVLIPQAWNQDMVIFAHGYEDARNAIQIPWDQLNTTTPSLPELVLSLGYAFGTTSYSKNGLAIKQGVGDVVKLAKHIRATNQSVKRVFLTGASEGGLVTALAIEKYPDLFAGALSTCGPVGSLQKQVQYWGDFRVVFDKYFPNALKVPPPPPPLPAPQFGPSTPIYIDPLVVQYWEDYRDAYVLPQLLAADPLYVQALLTETKVPVDPADPITTAGLSISQLLYYNVEATNDGRMTFVPGLTLENIKPTSKTPLAGNPYSNPKYKDGYPRGIYPDPRAIAEIRAYYETSGKLKRPLVVMHTTGDPVIPIEQSIIYTGKVAAQRSLSKLALIPINRYGHCNFEPSEIVFGFYVMVLRSTLKPFSQAQIQSALPEMQLQTEFKKLKEKNSDSLTQ